MSDSEGEEVSDLATPMSPQNIRLLRASSTRRWQWWLKIVFLELTLPVFVKWVTD
jgi:hypothetical protein